MTMISEEIVNEFKSIIEKIAIDSDLDSKVSQKVGEYLFYHNQIELILDELIESLIPEIDFNILNLDSFSKKLSLIKSLVPNSNELGIFSLLEKLNKARNVFAHEDPNTIDFEKINTPLLNLLNSAFVFNNEILVKMKVIGEGGPITIPVKVIFVTKIYLELIVKAEKIGKREDINLKAFESVRLFSSLYVRRRFSILIYQFQSGIKSDDVPIKFKQEELFAEYISNIKKAFFDFLKK